MSDSDRLRCARVCASVGTSAWTDSDVRLGQAALRACVRVRGYERVFSSLGARAFLHQGDPPPPNPLSPMPSHTHSISPLRALEYPPPAAATPMLCARASAIGSPPTTVGGARRWRVGGRARLVLSDMAAAARLYTLWRNARCGGGSLTPGPTQGICVFFEVH